MASVRSDSGLESGFIWAVASLDLPKPVEPCSICQRLVDLLRSSCIGEEPKLDSGLESDLDTPSACLLATWPAFQPNDGRPTCQKVVKTIFGLDISDLWIREDAQIRVNKLWEGSFTIKLRPDCQDGDKNTGFSLSALSDDTPWAGHSIRVVVDAS